MAKLTRFATPKTPKYWTPTHMGLMNLHQCTRTLQFWIRIAFQRRRWALSPQLVSERMWRFRLRGNQILPPILIPRIPSKENVASPWNEPIIANLTHSSPPASETVESSQNDFDVWYRVWRTCLALRICKEFSKLTGLSESLCLELSKLHNRERESKVSDKASRMRTVAFFPPRSERSRPTVSWSKRREPSTFFYICTLPSWSLISKSFPGIIECVVKSYEA